jgi:hypothetical protein
MVVKHANQVFDGVDANHGSRHCTFRANYRVCAAEMTQTTLPQMIAPSAPALFRIVPAT